MLSFVFLYTHWVCNLAIKQMAYYSLSSYGISRQVKEQILYKGSPVCMQSIVKYMWCSWQLFCFYFSSGFELGITLLFHGFIEVPEVFGLDHQIV